MKKKDINMGGNTYLRKNDEMYQLAVFVNQGILHGTLPEAIHWALTAALTGDASSITDALAQASVEWYK